MCACLLGAVLCSKPAAAQQMSNTTTDTNGDSDSDSDVEDVVEETFLRPRDFKFDFDWGMYEPNVVGLGGNIVNGIFPVIAETGLDAFLAVVNLHKPGASNLPHIHPRSGQTLAVTKGIIRLGIICPAEIYGDKALFTEIDLPKYSTAFIPKGCVHYETNIGFYKAQFAAFFNTDSPGVVTLPIAVLRLFAFQERLAFIPDTPLYFADDLLFYSPKNPAPLSRFVCDVLFTQPPTTTTPVPCGYLTISPEECYHLGCCFYPDEAAPGGAVCAHPFFHTIDALPVAQKTPAQIIDTQLGGPPLG